MGVSQIGHLYFSILAGISKFIYERKTEMNSGLSSKKSKKIDVIVPMAYWLTIRN